MKLKRKNPKSTGCPSQNGHKIAIYPTFTPKDHGKKWLPIHPIKFPHRITWHPSFSWWNQPSNNATSESDLCLGGLRRRWILRGWDSYLAGFQIYVCMHGCMYASTDVWVYGCMGVWMYGCMHACMYAWMDVCMYVCKNVCMYLWMYGCMDAWMNVCMDVCIYGCMGVWMYGCMDVWMYVCMHACMHGCMYVCMYA